MQESDAKSAPLSWVWANFELLENALNGEKSGSFHKIRISAFQKFKELGLPTSENEEWKYTNVDSINKLPFKIASEGSAFTADEFKKLGFEIPASAQAVFVDGKLRKDLSKFPAVTGLKVSSLAELLHSGNKQDYAVVEANFGKCASIEEDSFVALNTAFTRDGIVIKIDFGVKVEEPLHLIFITTDIAKDIVTNPRVLVVADANSEATIVESYIGCGSDAYMTAPVSEVVVGDGANLIHVKIQSEGSNAYHLASLHSTVSTNAKFSTYTYSFGGKLVRNDISPKLNGEGISATINGLTVIGGEQHVDNHTVLDHAKPHCDSTELFKGIYAGRSSGVFSGTIIVRPDAQKTNAFQSNQSLLLSKDATIDTKPQLKIWADDVKCTHGATVGQLDETALFYLRSRGIPFVEARKILIQAFAGELLTAMTFKPLRELLERLVSEALQKN